MSKPGKASPIEANGDELCTKGGDDNVDADVDAEEEEEEEREEEEEEEEEEDAKVVLIVLIVLRVRAVSNTCWSEVKAVHSEESCSSEDGAVRVALTADAWYDKPLALRALSKSTRARLRSLMDELSPRSACARAMTATAISSR
jgi:hypothetical protein